MQFGSAGPLRMHFTRIDCELYSKKNSVEAALPMNTFRELARRDFLVGSQDVERNTISFFTLWTVKRPNSLQ